MTSKAPPPPSPDALPPAAAMSFPIAEPSASVTPPTAARTRRKSQKARLPKSPKRDERGALAKDMLTSYMDQLSGLPLLSAQQELDLARQLREQEVRVWQLVLHNARGLEIAAAAAQAKEAFDADCLAALTQLDQLFHRAAARSHKRDIGDEPGKQAKIDELSASLRQNDFDKELLDEVMKIARQEVWSRRVLTDRPAYRLTHADLTQIERARGAALRTRNHFVRANLRLVVSVARNFHHFRIAFIDLIQEGNVGLMKAVHRFDHERGFRFSTYAHWWIRQSIERAIINKGSQVRLPVHVIDARRQVKRASKELTQSLGRTPNASEIALQMGTSAEKVEQVLTGVQQDPISLEERVAGEAPRKVLDLLRDTEADPIDEALIRENTHAKVRELLHLLNPIEKDIIRRRFGLGVDADQTLDEIGKRYNLSRERVRQIQAQSLQKMRRMCERRRID